MKQDCSSSINTVFALTLNMYMNKNKCNGTSSSLAAKQPGDLRLSGSIIRKSRFIFTKEWRTIRLKIGCLNNSNERIFQVNILMQMRIKDSWKGGSYVYKMLVSLCGFYLIYLKYSMKMK